MSSAQLPQAQLVAIGQVKCPVCGETRGEEEWESGGDDVATCPACGMDVYMPRIDEVPSADLKRASNQL